MCSAQGKWRTLDEHRLKHRPNITPTKRFLRVIPSVSFISLSSSILTVDLGMHQSRAVSANTWISAQQWHEIVWNLKQHIHHLSIIVDHRRIHVNVFIHYSDQCSASSIAVSSHSILFLWVSNSLAPALAVLVWPLAVQPWNCMTHHDTTGQDNHTVTLL